jgi:hypothetical protein
MFWPAAEVTKFAMAFGPATRVTPVGSPLKPDKTTSVVPSASLTACGKTSMCSVTDAPELSTKSGR